MFLEVVDNILVVREDVLQESQRTSNTSAKSAPPTFALLSTVLSISTRVLEAIDSVAGNIPITNDSEPVVIAQRSFAVSVQQVDLEEFSQRGQTFSLNLRNGFSRQNQSLSLDDLSFDRSVSGPRTGSISLSSSLFSALPTDVSNSSRITHAVFVTVSLFLRRNANYLEVGSIIISASVVRVSALRGINPPIGLNFQINPVSV